MRRRVSPPWRSCVGPTGSSAPGAPGGWLINWRLDRGFSNVPTAGDPVGYTARIADPDGHSLELSFGQEVGLTVQSAAKG
jgi:hypothetical protein